jgi:hypothetical protein
LKFIKDSIGCCKDVILFIVKKRLGKLIATDMPEIQRKK